MIPKLHDAEWLREQYVEQFRTLESIGEELGCNKATVGRALRNLGIEARKRTPKYPQLDDREWLYDAYIVQRRGLISIAKELGTSAGNVGEHLRQKGIPARTVREGMVESGAIPAKNRLGDKGKNWRGGRQVTTAGYIYVYAPDHPRATSAGYVLEHRLVMEQKLGRLLEPGEIVHHVDGNKGNNHPDNLEVKTNGQHISEHFQASHEVKSWRAVVQGLIERIEALELRMEEQERRYGSIDAV